MSILYLLVPAAALAVNELTKTGAPAPAPAITPSALPMKQVMPEIPDNPTTRAYAEAVAAVERFGKGPGSVTVFNGVSRWMLTQAQGEPTYPILTQKDLPLPPPGYIWRAVTKNSDASKSAYTIHYWEIGSPPPAVPVPTTPVPLRTLAPVPPVGGIPDTPKTRAYRNALLLKEQAEAQARGMSVAAVFYTVSADVLSQSELPTASQGFRWATGGILGPTWRYIRTSEPLAPDPFSDIIKLATSNPQIFAQASR